MLASGHPGLKIRILSYCALYMHVCSMAQSCPTLCDPMGCSPPGSSVHGISQARILSGLPFPTPGDLHNPGIKPASLVAPALSGGFFTTEPPGKPTVYSMVQ